MSSNFVHLHNHTEYSMLDGAARIKGLTGKAAELGMPGVGISDHGTMFGLYEFWKSALANGIKPVIGVEAYVTPGTHRVDRSRVQFGDGGPDDISQGGSYTHMTMWARNTEGMHNLFRLGSLASLEGFFYEPRMDRELLQTHGKGLIATTGCPSGEVQTYLRFGKYEQARHAAAEFQDIFGRENYYLELMDHGLNLERRVRDDLLRLAKDLKMPLLATNDIHYLHESDAHSHEALLCVGAGNTLLDPTREQGGKRFAFGGSGYYLKTAEQMRHLFRELPEACDNTLLITEQCDVNFVEQEGRYMPHFPTPDGEDETSFFIKEVERGLHERFSGAVSDEARQRATLETDVIVSKGYAGYYLVVADFIRWAKEQGIRVGPGRGSGPGSLAAYAMGITDLDPIRHRLFFERFLNPERMSMPDFDIDFDDTRRGEVINYVSQKYGNDAVAQIVTYGTIKAKAAIKDATRVTGKPFMLGEQMSKALPPDVAGNSIALGDTHDPDAKRYDEAGTFRELVEAKPEAQEVFDLAQQLEGLKRQWGVHAAGVVISSEPLLDVLPIMRRSRDGAILTQFDYPTCETLGLVKMDFLGLRTLTTIEHAVENIERNGKTISEIRDGPMDDRDTYDLLTRGETQAVFQLEGGGMRSLLRMVRPNRFEDIAAVVALYRPGPMGTDTHTNYALRKNGRQAVTPIHPELAKPLADILDDTHGLLVFQEQVMEIAQKVAGYTLGEADLLRRAMGKKKKEVLDAEYPKFRGGMLENGYSDESIETLWKILVPFSDYAFNRSHAAAYGILSYWTAYLKTHYPAEYMAAVLTGVASNKAKLGVQLAECRRMGLKVLPPDVNESMADFTASGENIRVGLRAVRNVGHNVVAQMISTRDDKGKAASFEDFVRKTGVTTKAVIESLIKAGAFDSMNHGRQGLMMGYKEVTDAVSNDQKAARGGEDSLFGEDSAREFTIPELEWDPKTLLSFEREMLGLYVSGHPLDGQEELLERYAEHSAGDIVSADAGVEDSEEEHDLAGADDSLPDGSEVSLAGLLTHVENKVSKKGDAWAKVTLEDFSGAVECLVFPRTLRNVSGALVPDSVVWIGGKVSRRDDPAVVFVDDVRPL